MYAIDIIVSILGLSFGSFLSACAYRIPRGISVTTQRSFCPGCQSSLRWYDIIPVLGFAINRGTCRSCGARIPMTDFATEIFTGILLLAMFLQYGMSMQFLFFGSFGLILTLIALIDWQHLIIPNKIVAIGVAAGVILRIVPWQWDALLDSLIGAAAAGAVLLCIMLVGNRIVQKQTMGMGDIKLAVLIGFYIGLEGFLVSLWTAALAGALFGLVRILLRRQPPDGRLPFGSFLAASSILSALFQTQLHEWIDLWLTSTLSY